MSYNPSLHTVTNKPLGIAQPVPTDARSWFYDADIFSYRPYSSKSEVMTYLDTVNKRKGQFAILITEGPKTQAYWFKNAYAAITDLVRMDGIYVATGIVSGSVATAAGELYDTLIITPTANATNVQIGITVGGTDIEFGLDMTAGTPYVYNIKKYFVAAGAFYITNLPSFDIILRKTDI